MSNILNLDEVASKEEKVLTLRGKEYIMESMTVEDFIAITKKEEALEKLGEKAPISGQISGYKDMVGMLFPSMSEETLNSLKLEQLIAVVGFANAPPEVEEEDDTSGKSSAKKAGKKQAN